MNRLVRGLLIVLGIVLALLCASYLLKLPFALALWPWPAMSPLSYLLLASLLATGAVGMLWPVLTRDDSSIASLGLLLLVIFGPLAVFGFQSAARGLAGTAGFGAVSVLAVLIGVGLVWFGWRLRSSDPRPLPGLVRWSFVVFIVLLIFFGGGLVLKQPNILPWMVTPELSVIFGWAFLGAAAFFGIALLRPGWGNSGGHLAAFLAYDLVLIVPFLQKLPTVAPELRLNLIVYIAALIYSGGLAIYYLFVNKRTRVW